MYQKLPFQVLSKIGSFGMKVYNLATLPRTNAPEKRFHLQCDDCKRIPWFSLDRNLLSKTSSGSSTNFKICFFAFWCFCCYYFASNSCTKSVFELKGRLIKSTPGKIMHPYHCFGFRLILLVHKCEKSPQLKWKPNVALIHIYLSKIDTFPQELTHYICN
jgi:hypothetical protein